MWVPLIVAIIVMLSSTILLAVLEKKGIIEKNKKTYRMLELIGVLIPLFVVVGNYAYIKTDTKMKLDTCS